MYNDGSTDDTFELATVAGAMVIRSPKNNGYGMAIRALFQAAKEQNADIMVTLGYYNKKGMFKIDTVLEDIFEQYRNLDKDFSFHISEISLVKSKYKNLRYPNIIQKYRI